MRNVLRQQGTIIANRLDTGGFAHPGQPDAAFDRAAAQGQEANMIEALVDQFTNDFKMLAWLAILLLGACFTVLVAYKASRRR